MSIELTMAGEVLKKTMDALMSMPKAKIDREKFLKQTFITYSEEKQRRIMKLGPVRAGLSKEELSKIAKGTIKMHKLWCSGTSFGLGIPGGLGMTVTIPGDLLNFYGHLLQVAQKLAYIYGFNLDKVPDETRAQILMSMLAIMLGVRATDWVKIVANNYAKQLGKKMLQSGATKYPMYKFLNLCARALGFGTLSKKAAGQVMGKAVPLVGGAVSGGITWIAFGNAGTRLQKHFEQLAFPKRNKSQKSYKKTKQII